MIKNKVYGIMDRDELLLHKVGFLFGSILGILGGLLISDKATQYLEVIEEVIEDGERGPE
jgi:hypothetical protein